jgi:hypothetical protein
MVRRLADEESPANTEATKIKSFVEVVSTFVNRLEYEFIALGQALGHGSLFKVDV